MSKIIDIFEGFVNSTGISMFFAEGGWKNLIMIAIACILLFLAIKKKFEPYLLLPIAFAMLLVNLPLAGDELFKKTIIETYNTEADYDLSFILPMVESNFIVFKIYEDNQTPDDKKVVWETIEHNIVFKSSMNNVEIIRLKLIEDEGIFKIGDVELEQSKITTINAPCSDNESIKMLITYLNSYSQVGVKTVSFQIISAEVIKN